MNNSEFLYTAPFTIFTDGPDITWGPMEVAGVQGSNTTLICGTNLDSNPPATIKWLDSDGTMVDSSNDRFERTDGPTVSLVVRDLVRSDTGTWTCEVFVKNMRRLERSISLTVVGKRTSSVVRS